MKKYIAWILLMGLVLSLIGCNKNTYELVCENGNYYAVVKNGHRNEDTQNIDVLSQAVPHIYFNSLSEMQEDIRNGSFTDKEYSALETWAEWYGDETGKAPVPNIDALFEPLYPVAAGNYQIVMTGDHYYYKFGNAKCADSISLHFSDDISYLNEQVSELLNFENSLFRGSKVYKIEDEEGGKSYYYTTGNGTNLKVHIYILNQEGSIVYVKEEYYLDDYSTAIPKIVEVYNISTDYRMHIYIDRPVAKPNSELILEFGLQEYVAEGE